MPAARPYGVGVGFCLFDRVEEVAVEPAKAGRLNGRRPAMTLTRRRISLFINKFDGDGVGASQRGALPGLRFFVLGEFLYWEFFYIGTMV